ncbi:MAG: DUF192 domain-containing protein [Alphaproteobacteria bacterium]|jgi:uncharacterized protein|nr:DUF192 domain-containing protein [Alphaproteobacteria bacterium]MBT5860522.1 DUF192 domain-containing protein [Alphaproteobacteria bacterium]
MKIFQIRGVRPGWLLGIVALVLVAACEGEPQPLGDRLFVLTEDARYEFFIEIAITPAQRSQGLMYRTELAANAGMLFQYGEPQIITMWMANTLIPLDMIFIAANGRIVSIAERTVPESRATIASEAPAVAVLEVPGGTADRLGIVPTDVVIHHFFGNTD